MGQEITEDEEEAKYLAKRKMLGNIKFIGELGKLQIVHDSILHRCAKLLVIINLYVCIVRKEENVTSSLLIAYGCIMIKILFQMLRAAVGGPQEAAHFRPGGRS